MPTDEIANDLITATHLVGVTAATGGNAGLTPITDLFGSVTFKGLGCECDGEADDTDAFAAALDELPDGSTVRLTGTMLLSDTTTLTSREGLTILGGRTGTMKWADGISTGKQMLQLSGCDRITVDGVLFDGNKGGVATQPDVGGSWNSNAPRKYYTPIDIQSSTNTTVRHCEFFDVSTSAINIENSQNTDVLWNIFRDSYMDPLFTISFGTNSGARVIGNRISNIRYASYAYGNGMVLNISDILIAFNEIDGVDRSGIKPFDAAGPIGARILYNRISNCDWQGINPQNGSDILIEGNLIEYCGSDSVSGNGIFVSTNPRGVVIRSNTCRNNRNSGIAIEALERFSLLQNDCYETRSGGSRTQANGIFVTTNNIAPVKHGLLDGNRARNNTAYGIYILDVSYAQGIENLGIINSTLVDNVTRGLRVVSTLVNSKGIRLSNNIHSGNGGSDLPQIDADIGAEIVDNPRKRQLLTAAGAIDVTASAAMLVGSASATFAVTLAAPGQNTQGQVLTIEMVTYASHTVTLALTNVEGGSAGTTATFDAVGEKLMLVAGKSKWTVIKEFGVTLS